MRELSEQEEELARLEGKLRELRAAPDSAPDSKFERYERMHRLEERMRELRDTSDDATISKYCERILSKLAARVVPS